MNTTGIEHALKDICGVLKDISSELHWIRLDFDAIKEEMCKGYTNTSVDEDDDGWENY